MSDTEKTKEEVQRLQEVFSSVFENYHDLRFLCELLAPYLEKNQHLAALIKSKEEFLGALHFGNSGRSDYSGVSLQMVPENDEEARIPIIWPPSERWKIVGFSKVIKKDEENK